MPLTYLAVLFVCLVSAYPAEKSPPIHLLPPSDPGGVPAASGWARVSLISMFVLALPWLPIITAFGLFEAPFLDATDLVFVSTSASGLLNGFILFLIGRGIDKRVSHRRAPRDRPSPPS
jgi:hypothetical protein